MEHLKRIVEVIENLEAEKRGLQDDIKEVYTQAKASGLDGPTIRRVLQLRKLDPSDRKDREAKLELYREALGMEPAGEAEGGLGHNSLGALKGLVDRIERLEGEKTGLQDDIKDYYQEARSRGYETPIIRMCLRLRKMDPSDRQKQETMLDLYKSALGME